MISVCSASVGQVPVAAPEDDEEEEPEWMFKLAGSAENETSGPVTLSELQVKLNDGLINRKCLIWRHPMDAWKRIEDMPAFEHLKGMNIKAPPCTPTQRGSDQQRGSRRRLLPRCRRHRRRGALNLPFRGLGHRQRMSKNASTRRCSTSRHYC